MGYQAHGTLGRALLEGAEHVKLFGEEIEVKAEICRLPGISGHADREGLLRWIQAFEKKPQQVFVVHGEDSVCDLFAERLQTEFGFSAYAPYSGAVYDLANGVFLEKPDGVRIRKDKRVAAAGRVRGCLKNWWQPDSVSSELSGKTRAVRTGIWSALHGRFINCVTAGSDKSGHPAWWKGHRSA